MANFGTSNEHRLYQHEWHILMWCVNLLHNSSASFLCVGGKQIHGLGGVSKNVGKKQFDVHESVEIDLYV